MADCRFDIMPFWETEYNHT